MSTPNPSTGPLATTYAQAPNKTVTADGTTFAYRELGQAGGIPVVFFVHLAATLDNWDPRIIDPIAKTRHVITFDNAGVGGSSGTVPDTIEEAADDAYRFITALGFEQIDIFSFSMGGMIAQEIVLKEPQLVRRMILAGTGPAGGEGIGAVAGIANVDLLRGIFTGQDPKQYLFFTRTPHGIQAGQAFLARLQERSQDRDQDISVGAYVAQLQALGAWGRKQPVNLSGIRQPVLIVNGDNDRMVPTPNSHDLARRLPNSSLIIYPDAGHGGVFQNHATFVSQALAFLER